MLEQRPCLSTPQGFTCNASVGISHNTEMDATIARTPCAAFQLQQVAQNVQITVASPIQTGVMTMEE